MPKRNLGQGQEVPFFDYAPDLSWTTPGIILDASAMIPTVKGYQARRSPAQYAPALPLTGGGATEAPLGGYIALFKDGTTKIYVGTATRLFRLDAGPAWTTVGSGYTATWPWVFSQFGEDVLATSGGNTNMQIATGAAGAFANLGGTPPTNAVSVITVAGFAAAFNGSQWFNSAAGNDAVWVPNVQVQSGSGFLYDVPGSIVAAEPFLRNMIVWKANSTWMLTYIGGTQVWSSQVLSPETGTWGQLCVCPYPSGIAFLGTDDFYTTSGYQPTRIPNNFKEDFFTNVAHDVDGNPTDLQYTTSWYDPFNAIVYWHYVSMNTPTAHVPDQYVGWNSRSGRWTHGYLNTPLVIPDTQPGVMSGLYFDTNNVLQSWIGNPGNSYLLTGYQGDPDNLTQLQKVRIAYTTDHQYPTSQTLIPMHTNILGQPPTVEASGILATDGWFNTRQTDRYHQCQINTVGPCELQAVAYELRVSGVR